MVKSFILTVLISVSSCIGLAQYQQKVDSLKHDLAVAMKDTARIRIMIVIGNLYYELNLDSSLKYGKQALALAKSIGDFKGEARALVSIGFRYRIIGDYPRSLEALFMGLQIAEDKQYTSIVYNCLNDIGVVYRDLNDYPKAIVYYQQALPMSVAAHDEFWIAQLNANIANTYRSYDQIDSAFFYVQKAFVINDSLKSQFLERILFREMGVIQFEMGNHESAFENLQKCILINQKDNNHRRLSEAYNILADFFKTLNNSDSAIYYSKKGLNEAVAINQKKEILQSSKLLGELYESRDQKEALYYYKMASAINDSLFGAKKTNELQKTLAEEQERQRQAEANRIAFNNQLKQYAFLASLAILFLIAFLLYRNNLREKKAKNQLQDKNKVIEQTLSNLKSTQSQLIQSEKMASLGELTAGIAHEIQNPLNFMNNFSEVNAELIEEMKEELNAGNNKDAIAIANNIKENEDKINHHGKRADAIVKGMLQHSRTSTGQKEPTDINTLADEYLRLSYHGLRAKDKSFNTTMETDFDPTIGRINIIPQDIGRVLLNLYNNAFYTVSEKKKQQPGGYEPTISVSTKRYGNNVEVRVKDNGNGIPRKVLDKIFQPFFTTKPAGQGTGLGLSMSYDIIKAHGGEMKVESKEGEGARFVVQIPIA